MYSIPESYKNELVQYRAYVEKALINEVDPVQFKIFRVVRGIYEQRTKGRYMVRIRCAGGIITPSQLNLVSNLGTRFGSAFMHITTRQEIQLHNLQLADTPNILEELYEMGLSTKGSGGNTVRNITASIESGIWPTDVFDVTYYNIALTNFLIGYEKSFDLPRKLKIAFSSSESDTALAVYNDLGFIAKMKDGVKGFKVFLGGSPSVKPMVGEVLFDFIPAEKIVGVALAVIEMFNLHGNRKNRHKARLRYMFYKLGKEKVFELFEETYNQFKHKTFEPLNIFQEQIKIPKKISLGSISEDGIDNWVQNYVSKQVQEGLCAIEIPVMHGNLTNEQAKSIAEFAVQFGEETIRFSRRQNLHLRNIPEAYLGILYNLLNNIEIETNRPYLLGNLVSCTGADTCQLGICFSKGGLQAIHDKLSNNDLIGDLKNVSINISGCPNSCGQHLIADLGFAGRVSRNERIYPSYNVFAGAVVGEHGSSLPIQLGEVAAKDLPEFTNDILNLYHTKSLKKPFREFVEQERDSINQLLYNYKQIPSFAENKKYYIDWGNNDLFTLDARGGGECSAGLLDMIESEIKILEKCKESFTGQQEIEEQTVLLHEMVHSASKLVCLTIQEQPDDEKDLFATVQKQFIEKGRIANDFTSIFTLVNEGNFAALIRQKELVVQFADEAVQYYQNLDDSLQLKFEVKEITAIELKALMDNKADIHIIDVRESWEKEIADIGGELIPLGTLEANSNTISEDKKTIIYCRTGRRSSEAISLLAKKCKTDNLFNLKGGIYAWADEIDSSIQKY